MTRAVRDRILKDANGDISDHLRNHIHLTNCIHLKNHMHKQSPILADRSLMRDLVVLQRSRSLKDPSMSPPSWQSADHQQKMNERDGNIRRSLGTDKQNHSRRLSGDSPVLDRAINRERRRSKIEESTGKNLDLGSDDMEGDDVASSSHVPFHRKQAKNTRKRRNFKGSRTRRENQVENEVSVASNSFLSRDENLTKNSTRDPRNGCGIRGNWSRIHDRGKSVSRGQVHQERDFSDMPVLSDHSNSYSKSQVEASPLLFDTDTAANWEHDYSGELGIFADRSLKRNHYANRGSRHENLTQKYNPRSFRDLVGQSLVVQALTNAVAKRKIGLLYVFYGPHGTGKTSCARIFARALNCHSIDHVKPCNICDSCIANETGKNRSIQEIGPVSTFNFDKIMNLLESREKQYKVFIFNDCDSFSPSCWNSVSKIVDRAPNRLVFLLVSSSLDNLPHIIVSRCQRFFFPKLKDSDIIYTLQWIGSKEDLDIDKDALKLITSRSDGSLRDALMTLDQLTLLGQKISVPLVQELVGLISDDKLVDLLDLALSADTVNTVRNLREIMETGVEPLALMSQLATVITDILAGSYDYTKERPKRKFFRRQSLSKEDMEKLRQALKTLSEAEKQLRLSTDRLTWLTAALLQLAPDQQYLLPSSSNGLSLNLNDTDVASERVTQAQASISKNDIEEIWFQVLENIRVDSVRDFMREEGKLISVSFGTDPTVQLMFVSHLAKSRAEKFKRHILEGFESVLGSPLTIQIKYGSKSRRSNGGSSHDHPNPTVLNNNKEDLTRSRPSNISSEIVELEASPVESRQRHRKTSTTVKSPCKSIVKSKVSLAHVIQQAEGWSKLRNFSMSEKLEHENLRLEPRSRSLLCWKSSRTTRRKISRLKIRTRKPHALLKYVSCGKCLMTRSPRT